MTCTIEQLNYVYSSLLGNGYTAEQAQAVVRLISERDTNPEFSKQLQGMVTDPISDADREYLKTTVSNLVTNAADKIGDGDALTFEGLLGKLLPEEDVKKTMALVKKIRIADGNIGRFSLSFVEELDFLIETNRNLGRESAIPQLLEQRQRALQKQEQDKTRFTKDQEKRNNSIKRIEQLKQLLEYVEFVMSASVDRSSSDALKTLGNARDNVRQIKAKIKMLQKGRSKFERIADLFVPGARGKPEALESVKNKRTEINKLKEELKKAEADEVAALEAVKDKKIFDTDGKLVIKLKSIANAEEQIRDAIDKEVANLTNVSANEITNITAAATKSLAEKLAQERIASRNINASVDRMKNLVSMYSEQAKEAGLPENEIDHIFMGTIVGKAVVEKYLREKRTTRTDDKVETDRSPFTTEEAMEIINDWKRLAWRGAQTGTFSDDMATATESQLMMLQSLATKSGIVNPLSVDVNNLIVKQDRTGAEAAMQSNIGTIPKENEAKTARELASWLEYTIRGLYSLRTSPFYSGTVSQKAIDMVLHPKLYDIAIHSDSLGTVSKNKRKLGKADAAMYVGRLKELLKDLGVANVENLPEFQDGFNESLKAIAYDIETDSDKPTEILSMQIKIQDPDTGEESNAMVFMNADDSDIPVNSITDDRPKKPMTKNQIRYVLNLIEQHQNKGFKLITFAGNHFDLGKLLDDRFSDDKKLVSRIALRSFDLQRNLAFDNQETRTDRAGQYYSSKPKNVRLKAIGENNLEDKREEILNTEGSSKQKFIITNGAVYEEQGGAEVEITGAMTKQMFQDANNNKPHARAKFNLYAKNDVDVTMSLFNRMMGATATEIKVVHPLDSGLNYSIMAKRPRSNMTLPLSEVNTHSSTLAEIMQDYGDFSNEMREFSTDVEYTEELDINLDKLIALLENWYMQVLALDPDAKERLNQLDKALADQIAEETLVQRTAKETADRMADGVKKAAKANFDKHGYVLELELDANGNVRLEGSKDESGELVSIDESRMMNTTRDAEEYERHLIEAFVRELGIKASEIFKALETEADMPPKQVHETAQQYSERVLLPLLNKYFKIDALRDFGNGNVDWHSATDVGKAIAHILLNRKEGMHLADTKTLLGELPNSEIALDVDNVTTRGVPKYYLLGGVNYASPWGISEEALMYDNFRLMTRMKDILERDLSEDEIEAILAWAETPESIDRNTALSTFMSGPRPTVFPKAGSRSAYEFVPNLSERELIGQEFLFDIPRLLMFMNHDAFYTPLASKGRWLTGDVKQRVFYAQDFFTAGAPTAKMILSGAVDQIAWLVSWDRLSTQDPKLMQILEKSLSDGIDAVRADPNVQDRANKTDYSYHGIHVQLMLALNYMRNKNPGQDPFTIFVNSLISKMDTPAEADVRRDLEEFKEKNDPRNKINAYLLEVIKEAIDNPESVQTKYRLSDNETQKLVSIATILSKDTPERKELLKGIITPAMYDAGIEGISSGIMTKVEKEGISGIALDDAVIVARVVTAKDNLENSTALERAIGIATRGNAVTITKDKIISTLKDMALGLNNNDIESVAEKNFFGEMDHKKRLDAQTKYFNTWVDQLADKQVSKAGKTEEQIEKDKKELVTKLKKRYEERMQKANEVLAKHDMTSSDVRSNRELQDAVNTIMSGSERAYRTHLILNVLGREAATPFKLLVDKKGMHSAYAGQHIDDNDVMPFVGRTLFHAKGLELASGRHHMFGNYTWGPQGSKASQVRVLHGKERNEMGIWDIEEVYKPSEKNKQYRKAYAQQLMLDLMQYYVNPMYDVEQESLENYFMAMSDRSSLERLAIAKARGILRNSQSIKPSDPNYNRIKETEKALGKNNFEERLGFVRSGQIRDETKSVILDPTVSGLAALRPRHADVDFSQRGIYSLISMMKSREIEQNNMFKRQKLLQQMPKEGNPNDIIPARMRGFVKTTDKKNMPFVPHQTGNMVTSLIMTPEREVEVEATRLRNSLSYFAEQNGLQELLERGEWARLWMIKEWRRQGLEGSTQEMKKLIKAGKSNALMPRIALYEAIFKLMGTNARAYAPNKTYNAYDIMAKPEEINFSEEEIRNLRDNFPDGLTYLNALRHMANNWDRLKGLQNDAPLVLAPFMIARGPANAMVENAPRMKATSVFNMEANNNLYVHIMMTDVFQEEAEKVYKDDPTVPRADGRIELSALPNDKNKSIQILRRTLERAVDVAQEWENKKLQLLVTREQLGQMLGKEITQESLTGESYVGGLEAPLTMNAFEFASTNNPDTLFYFTPNGIIQVLNALRNDKLITAFELAYMTNKEIGFANTDADILIMENQNQLMDNLGRSVDLTHRALVMLHTMDPRTNKENLYYRNNYRKTDKLGNPVMVLDATRYIGESFKITLRDKNITSTRAVSLETMLYATDIMAAIDRARKLGMNEEADELSKFMLQNLVTKETPEIETSQKTRSVAKDVAIKAVVLRSRLSNVKAEMVDGLRDTIMAFIQDHVSKESSKKIFEDSLHYSRLIQKINDTNPELNQVAYYVATSMLARLDEINGKETVVDPSFINMVAKVSGTESIDSVARSIMAAQEDLKKFPEPPSLTHLTWDVRRDVARFADANEFINAFGDTGRGIVDMLRGMVKNGLMTQRTMDLKLILLGSLAAINPTILSDLALDASEFDGHTYAKMSKQKGKYVIGLNINAMKVTSENEMLLRFAEELVHLARTKFMADGSADYRHIQSLFRLPTSEGMIREMLLAMNDGKPYQAVERDVQHAMENTDEFLAHWGAVVLLSETIYNKDTIEKLEAKYSSVEKATVWWKRAFGSLRMIAIRSLKILSNLAMDPKYSESYNQMYGLMQGIIGNGMAGKTDVLNGDRNYFAVNTITPSNIPVTEEITLNIRRLMFELTRLNDLRGTAKAAAQPRIAEIEAILSDPNLNPIGIMGMRESDVVVHLDEIERSMDGNIMNINENPRARRALLQRALTNYFQKRGRRVDNIGTLGGAIRTLFSGMDDWISLTLQNKLLQSMNSNNLTYNSPEAILVFLSEVIDNTAVTTQSSYKPSDMGGGFELNKEGLKSYVGDLINTSNTIRYKYSNQSDIDQIVKDAALIANDMPPTGTNPEMLEDAKRLAGKQKLFNDQLRTKLVDSKIKDRADTLDRVGLKLVRSTKLSPQERSLGHRAVVNTMRAKYLTNLDTQGNDAIVNPFLLYVGGLMVDPSTHKDSLINGPFKAELSKFLNNPGETALTAEEAVTKQLVNAAIDIHVINQRKMNPAWTRKDTLNTMVYNNNLLKEEILTAVNKLIIQTRENTNRFSSAFNHLNNGEVSLIVSSIKDTVGRTTLNSETKSRIDNIKRNTTVFGFYQGISNYIPEDTTVSSPMDIIADEFLGRLGSTAYLFSDHGPYLTYKDIFLQPPSPDMAHIQKMFERDISTIQQSLLHGSGYDAIQRMIVQRMIGIDGAFYSMQQMIDMFRSEIQMKPESNNNYDVRNFDNRDDEHRVNTLLMGLDRLEHGNAKSKEIMGNRLEGKPLIDAINKYGPMATTLAYGPNAALATTLVEGTLGALGSALHGNNPLSFVMDTMKMNLNMMGSSVSNIVRRRDGKVSWFNIDPYLLSKTSENALWMMEETISPQIPGQLTVNALTADEIERMSATERFMAFTRRGYSDPMRAIRVAAENQANRAVTTRLRDGSLEKLRESVNKILRNNPNPSNSVLQEVMENAKVSMDVELLLVYVRSGIFEPNVIETLQYAMSAAPVERNMIQLQVMGDVELNLKPGQMYDKTSITKQGMYNARNTMVKLMKQYAQLHLVMDHPLDGIASDQALHLILMFYKSYPSLFMAQQVMRRGSIAPAMRHAFELMHHALLDTLYNIILALASGWYKWHELMKRLEEKNVNWLEVMKMVLRYPVFSMNLIGFFAQTMAQLIPDRGRDQSVINSVGEVAIVNMIKNLGKAIGSYYYFAIGQVGPEHPAFHTYMLSRGFLSFLPGNTLIRMLLMQSAGHLNTAGTKGKRSYDVQRSADMMSHDRQVYETTRDIFGNLRQPQATQPPQPKIKMPEFKVPKIPTRIDRQPSLQEQATTPIQAPTGL